MPRRKRDEPDIFRCRVCDRRFYSLARLGTHYYHEHQTLRIETFDGLCKVCGADVTYGTDTAKHWIQMSDEELAHHWAVMNLCH